MSRKLLLKTAAEDNGAGSDGRNPDVPIIIDIDNKTVCGGKGAG